MPLAPELPRRLRARLAQALPGRVAQRQMDPELSFGRHAGPAPEDARAAAVIVLLYPEAAPGGQANSSAALSVKEQAQRSRTMSQAPTRWAFPLTRRPAHMLSHARQISLPGGAVDGDEESSAAALRELREELGVDPVDVRLVGALSELYVFGTNFLVTPWVGVTERRPAWQPSPDEVEQVLEIPLTELAATGARSAAVHRRGPLEFRAPHFALAGQQVWGATAMILSELLEVLHTAQDAAESTP